MVVLVGGEAIKNNRITLDGRWDRIDTKDSANVADLISQGKCLYYDHPVLAMRELRSLLSWKRRLKRQEHGLSVRIRNHLIAQYFPELDKYYSTSRDILVIVSWCPVRRHRTRRSNGARSGVSKGRRDHLVGGGLIRSLGGWAEVKGEKERVRDRIKGDERILGGGDFVTEMLAEANEQFELRYRLKRMGFDLEKVADKVASLYGVDAREIMTKGRRKQQVGARSLLCYWAIGELGMGVTELARAFGMTPFAVGYAARRGKDTAEEKGYSLD